MIYEYEDGRGGSVTVENNGENTSVYVSSSSAGQQQSQGSGFTTGELQGEPELYQRGRDYLLCLPTKNGVKGVRIAGSQSQFLHDAPDTAGAERLQLKKVEKSSRHSGGMEPMKPMEGMKPMQPMKPMSMSMGNMHMSTEGGMEMRMGDMHLKMGGK